MHVEIIICVALEAAIGDTKDVLHRPSFVSKNLVPPGRLHCSLVAFCSFVALVQSKVCVRGLQFACCINMVRDYGS